MTCFNSKKNFEMAEQGSTEATKDDSTTQPTDPTEGAGIGDGAKTSPPVSVSQFMMSNKTESIMWLLRLFTLVSTFFFLFPIFGVAEGGHFYQRALLANALTSACRLHQRLPRFQFSRAYVTQALLEDSCHYLLYSLIFITSYPITCILHCALLCKLNHFYDCNQILWQDLLHFKRENLGTYKVLLKGIIYCSPLILFFSFPLPTRLFPINLYSVILEAFLLSHPSICLIATLPVKCAVIKKITTLWYFLFS